MILLKELFWRTWTQTELCRTVGGETGDSKGPYVDPEADWSTPRKSIKL